MATNNPPKPPRVSQAMARVLLNLYAGRHPWEHLRGRSMFGGANSTDFALRRRGWIKRAGSSLVLTDAGREVAAALAEVSSND